MQFVLALPTIITILALAFMGFLVARNSQATVNKLFLVFVLVDISWIVPVFLVVQTKLGSIVLLSRIAFAAALGLIIATQAFTGSLLKIKHGVLYRTLLYVVGPAVLLVTLATPWVISGVSVASGLPFPIYGLLYPLFIIYLIATTVVFLVLLFKKWRAFKKDNDITMRRQLDTLVIGFVLFTAVSLITNLILPAVLANSWPSKFMPIGSLVLAASFFYAMSRYRLFDIRTAVVRGTTYVFLVAALASTFVLAANITSSHVTAFRDNPNLQVIFNAVVALLIAVSFQPLKRSFDKLTNKYFFRDIYDTQQVVDSLNAILISSTDVVKMLSLCESLLVDKLKLESCFFGISKDKSVARIIGYQKVPLEHNEYAVLRRGIFGLHDKVVSADDVPSGMKEVQRVFKTKEIGAVGKMISHRDAIGFVVFGNKKNGSPLSLQDLGVLGIVADQLAIATQNVLRFEEIQHFNITLQQKVDEATKKLRKTNERLRVLDQTKDDFISMASHQLRTPLTSVKGYVSMVLDGDGGKINETQRKLLTQSFLSAQRMVYLISDLLNVSRLKTGKFIIEPIESDLAKVIEEEVEQLTETVKGRGLTLNYHKPEHFPLLMVDETKLRQVIMNFVDNAIYYTPSGGHIDLYLEDKGESIEFRVVDDGIGVPKHEQHHLFSKFYRAHNAKRARPDGTGLGIFMAKKVVVAQGGAVIFKSTEGKGSTFGFTFPKSKLLPKTQAPVKAQQPAKA